MMINLIEFFERRPEIWNYIYDGTFKDLASNIRKAIAPGKSRSIMREIILKESQRLLSNLISLNEMEHQLINFPIISTADHHGLLNYKSLYNSNILYYLILKEINLPFMVVLSTGNIPLMNVSHPRGFYFNGRKFNFFRKKQNNTPVFLVRNKLHADAKLGLASFILNYSEEILSPEDKKFIEYLFFICLEIEKVEEDYEIFSDQITFLNHKLWKFYFEKSTRADIPDIIYLQANQIILKVLMEEMKKDDSIVSLILFDPGVRRIFLKNFSGIPGCWGEAMGSHFFWGIKEDGNKFKVISLHVDDAINSLVGEDIIIALKKETIIDALLRKRIFPTLFLDTLLITFQEGFLALGGLNQLEYLPQMQKMHIRSLIEIGMKDLAIEWSSPIANGLICGMMPFDFDSGIDLIWHYNSHNGKFNGNLDRGLTQEDLDRVNNTLVTELISSGIDKTLGIG